MDQTDEATLCVCCIHTVRAPYSFRWPNQSLLHLACGIDEQAEGGNIGQKPEVDPPAPRVSGLVDNQRIAHQWREERADSTVNMIKLYQLIRT